MSLSHFDISLDVLGHGSVKIDGQEHADEIAGLHIEAEAGKPIEVWVKRRAGSVAFAGEGILHTEPPQDMLETLAALVLAVDPADLEAKALMDPDLAGDEHALTAAMLRVIAGMLRARA